LRERQAERDRDTEMDREMDNEIQREVMQTGRRETISTAESVIWLPH
jgi:hypothetical protein